ncbi:unnamed protein product, partial [Mesorhabditis spiculigera]
MQPNVLWTVGFSTMVTFLLFDIGEASFADGKYSGMMGIERPGPAYSDYVIFPTVPSLYRVRLNPMMSKRSLGLSGFVERPRRRDYNIWLKRLGKRASAALPERTRDFGRVWLKKLGK